MHVDTSPHSASAERLAHSRAEIARWLLDSHATDLACSQTLPQQAARVLVSSLARRHPWGLMAGAAAAGAALATWRPWRRPLGPALFGSVVAPVLAELAVLGLRRALGAGTRAADAGPPQRSP